MKSSPIQLSLTQIADLLGQLSHEEIATLEELLDKKTTYEVIKRSKDDLKKGFSHHEMLEMFS